MGNICTNNLEKDSHTETCDNIPRNTTILSGNLGDLCRVDVVNGTYKYHRAETLLIITSNSHYEQCEGIRQYCPDVERVLQTISSSKKVLTICNLPSPSKVCNPQYKTIAICVLPQYKSQDSTSYSLQFRNVVREIIDKYKEIALFLTQTVQRTHSLPNQMLLTLMFKEILSKENSPSNNKFRLVLLSNEKKMLNLIKFELMKTEACTFGITNPMEFPAGLS